MSKIVVIGAGIAGLTATLRCVAAGHQVTTITKGIGGLQLGQGTMDILGYMPNRVERPLDDLAALADEHPDHPYAILNADAVRTGVDYFAELVGEDLLVGDPERNVFLPTAVGALRPTALAQPSMMAGQLSDGDSVVMVGIRQLKDFYPDLAAQNLARSTLPDGGRAAVRATYIDLPARKGEVDATALTYARVMDDPKFRQLFVTAVKKVIEPGEKVGLPAMLGIKDPNSWREVAEGLGTEVFEVPLQPPSVPGMRLNQTLVNKVKNARVRWVYGSQVLGGVAENGRLTGVVAGTTGHNVTFAADAVIHAPGGFESGALELDSYNHVFERTFDLPLAGADNEELLHGNYWGEEQPLFRVGVRVDAQMRPVDADGSAVYENLHAAGGIIANANRWREKSGDGIAVASAVRAADSLAGTPTTAAVSGDMDSKGDN